MKAIETDLFTFLNGNRQFIIPIYQRTYSWDRQQCEQLWNDIIRAATTPDIKSHFVGSIVYIQQGLLQAADVAQLLVIDGQQRLTSLTLLLVALAETARQQGENDQVNADRIYDHCLINRYERGDKRYKLLLTQSDLPTLKSIVDGNDSPRELSQRLIDNFTYFKEQIQRGDHPLSTIYQGIAKLVLVDITLNRDQDNPQLIFESLNSTGIDLSEADLIRNYILMRLEPTHQQYLYEHHWFPMEQLFGLDRYATHFDRFIRDYLTIKTRVIPRIDTIYKVFKDYREHPQSAASIDEITADLHYYAKLYVQLAFGGERNLSIQEAFNDINEIEVNVAYPFLLEAYSDYTQDRLSQTDFLAVIRLVESYVFRRAICGIPTNTLNRTFATLMRDVDKTNYRKSVERAFTYLSSYKRLPPDDEFRREFVIKDVYNFQRRGYLLRKLERFGRKEPVDFTGITIEHIMPQNPLLSKEWKDELGPDWQKIQEQYLHTIGNITLTGYNSEMSDKPFREKCEKGFRQSPFRLNQHLCETPIWDEAAIKTRAARMAELALKIWSAPHSAPNTTFAQVTSNDSLTTEIDEPIPEGK